MHVVQVLFFVFGYVPVGQEIALTQALVFYYKNIPAVQEVHVPSAAHPKQEAEHFWHTEF